MKLSEIRQILGEEELCLTKSLGQNFLHDENQLRRIIEAAGLDAQSKVLEIGPGLGPLTERLLETAAAVLAIEKDQRLLELLSKRFADRENLTLAHADALDFLKAETRDWSSWKLVANLPYSVASPILVELALNPRGPERMTVTVQREVARRLCANAGRKDFGVLSLLIQLNYHPREEFKISASCFFPEPAVDSACVTLARRDVPLLSPELVPPFARLVKIAFSQRRKMMWKLLKSHWPESLLKTAFERAELSFSARAESATLGQYARLTQSLNDSNDSSSADSRENQNV